MTVADEEKSLPKRLAIFQRTRELSKRDFCIYYQKVSFRVTIHSRFGIRHMLVVLARKRI